MVTTLTEATDLLLAIDRMLVEEPTALLTTIDAQGRPRARWMVPRRINGRGAYLYAATERGSGKIARIQAHPAVEWVLGASGANTLCTVRGPTAVVESATLLQEFLEAAGRDLFGLWRTAANTRLELVILETVIEDVSLYDGRTGETREASVSGLARVA